MTPKTRRRRDPFPEANFGSFENMPTAYNGRITDQHTQWKMVGEGESGLEAYLIWLDAHDHDLPFEEMADDVDPPTVRPHRPPVREWRF